ncbi:5-(carboxyamino)imidazole ribonucleotide synthase [Microcella frigidaquae]|uniref:N5-carboxyaminoimidazole ribonucleotide synthase n=1 Tax=Microcella frigidaquae TaxID=424758 RepID=A0A840XBT9_9MICO|nr:5-(carboxyamino)imidazole ribonucleotide synthase [Microcella frigidaquae]MBB5618505.1 5-(carboxyamino)imidazole ribonucleotide synthase [Microcella frigidaquae]NHN44596.1 5-(carboxyamino)imidazole ribonucleotide synthase [Microcella frigidaquae]
MAVVGVIGGGQLARMMIPPATALGLEIRVLAEAADSSARLAASAVGDYRDTAAVLAFAEGCDVITFDHEHVPQEVLRALVAAGAAVHPGPDALLYAQDKLQMRERLSQLGVAQPDWARVSSADELGQFLTDHAGRAVVKTPRGGYDGKGVRVVDDPAQVADWLADGPLLAEELVRFDRELAQLIARRPSGDARLWPLVETVQRGGVCAEVIAPAPQLTDAQERAAAEIATTIAHGLGVTGVLAVELFQAADGRVLVNELAMRPHNSGHVTIEGSTTSQFEQHLRAVLDWPLGDTTPRAPWGVMINVFGGLPDDRIAAALAHQPEAKVHAYGKGQRPGRKAGHVTVIGAELDDVVYRARAAASHFDA